MKRILSLIIALVAAAVGMPLLWAGSGIVLMSPMRTYAGSVNLLGVVIAVLGILLLAVATATIAFSSLGAIISGAIQTVVGLVLLLAPWPGGVFGGHTMPMVVELYGWMPAVSLEFSTGWAMYAATGTGLLLGLIQLVSGLMVRGRARSAVAGVAVGAGAGTILGGLGLWIIYVTGEEYYRQSFTMMAWNPLLGAALALGAFLVAATFVSLRWTSIAAYIVGAAALVVGLLGLAPQVLMDVFQTPTGASTAFMIFTPVGAVAIAAGLAASVRGRRNGRMGADAAAAGAVASPWYPGHEGQYPPQGYPGPQGQPPAQPGYPAPQGYPGQQGHPGAEGYPPPQDGDRT